MSLLQLTCDIWGRDRPNNQSHCTGAGEIIFVLRESSETTEHVTDLTVTYIDSFGSQYTSEFSFFEQISKLAETRYAEEIT